VGEGLWRAETINITLWELQLEGLEVIPLKVRRREVNKLFQWFNIRERVLPFICLAIEIVLCLFLLQASFDPAFDCLIDLA
jgi:hypothetical protein